MRDRVGAGTARSGNRRDQCSTRWCSLRHRGPDQVRLVTGTLTALCTLGASAWVAGDEVYGGDPTRRAELEGVGYVLTNGWDAGSHPGRAGATRTRSPRLIRAERGTAPSAGAGAKGERHDDSASTSYSTLLGLLTWSDTGAGGSARGATASPASWRTTAAGPPRPPLRRGSGRCGSSLDRGGSFQAGGSGRGYGSTGSEAGPVAALERCSRWVVMLAGSDRCCDTS